MRVHPAGRGWRGRAGRVHLLYRHGRPATTGRGAPEPLRPAHPAGAPAPRRRRRPQDCLTGLPPSFILEGTVPAAATEEPDTMVNSISADILARRAVKAAAAGGIQTAFLVFDTESVPDGRLIARVKYPGAELTPEEAIARAQAEARELSRDGSDFLPVTFQVPVAVCVLRVGADFAPQGLACLDAPQYRTSEIVKQFWRGVAHYSRAKLVTFN